VATEKFEMTLSLNVLKHLGINLYSSNPAVLSEAVANAWDADAANVDITLDVEGKRVVVQDDGIGMTLDDINNRYLRVGYERRKDGGNARTPSGRLVMGRKGIGKLALFSIAKTVLVETVKNGQKNALLMELDAINDKIGGEDPAVAKPYHPTEMPTESIDFENGTRITLTDLKHGTEQTGQFLRRRLARRFTVIGPEERFEVRIDGTEITVADRDLASLTQYAWLYNEPSSSSARDAFAHVSSLEDRLGEVGETFRMGGWIGTVLDTSKLKEPSTGETLNKIPLIIRGKLAQEDVLDQFSEVGIYRSYLVGEIHADFLDLDDDEDIATSSRQSIREDDNRYRALIVAIGQELKHIKSKWTDLRNADGTKTALDIPEVKDWYLTLGKDTRVRAERLFGKINQLGLDDSDRNELFAQGILAFEIMKQKDNLDALEAVEATDLPALGKILSSSAELEAVMYHNIVKSRLAVIDKLDRLVGDNEKEAFLQEHLFEHLWLLDPGWERAAHASMEQSMKKAFAEVTDKLSQEERDSRYDIRYQRTSGLHVIVELKRAKVLTDTNTLYSQVIKYRVALLRWLASVGRENEPIAIVCVVGRDLRDWNDPGGRKTSIETLRAIDTRVILYDELLLNARNAYSEYLSKNEEIGRVQKILEAVRATSVEETI